MKLYEKYYNDSKHILIFIRYQANIKTNDMLIYNRPLSGKEGPNSNVLSLRIEFDKKLQYLSSNNPKDTEILPLYH